MALSIYDRNQTYLWNYEHAPEIPAVKVPDLGGDWTYCGLPVRSPLGVAAGPLLNGRWVLYYAALGFDVLTYKTVRSRQRDCYPLPNLQPVQTGTLSGEETQLSAIEEMHGSWAVSFGMPSMSPEDWRRDVEWTRDRLPAEKLLSVSVVGSIQSGWSVEELALDYAKCAQWAVNSGANCIEANFSCPNVSTCDGQLYQQPLDAAIVASAIRDRIGTTPLVIKIGHMADEELALKLLCALEPHIDALAMTNSVATTVRQSDGNLLWEGEKRGICGAATFEPSLKQTEMFDRILTAQGWMMRIIGVGGIRSARDVQAYLGAGAEAVQLATAVMLQPDIALDIRRNWETAKAQ